MSKTTRLGLKLFAIALAVAVTSSSTLYFAGSPLISDAIEAARPTVRVGGVSYSVRSLSAAALPKEDGPLAKVGSMENLLGIFKEMGLVGVKYARNDFLFGTAEDAPAAAPSPAMAAGSVSAEYSSSDTGYSRTNSQVQGVEEGDVVKTDGRYIYHLTWDSLRIFTVDGADMRLVSTISFAQDETPSEMYISDDRLVTVSVRYEYIAYADAADGSPASSAAPDYYRNSGRQFTRYTVYDISDRSAPKVDREFSMEGYSAATRLMGDWLFFAVNKWVYSIPETVLPEDILPLYRDSKVSGDVFSVPPEDIYCFPRPQGNAYLMVGSFNLYDGEPAVFDSYIGAGQTMYMSGENLYIAQNEWIDGADKTTVYRFAVRDGTVEFAASGTVDGYLLNQYSMDEYGGVLRVATTDWAAGSYVTALDAGMNLLGRTEALAQGETIHSVRFMGDMGYVVTYRQTDPLFSIDLSDPANPKVLGALKIPGFSQYLHPVGDNLLIGFGRHTAETFVRRADGTEEPLGVIDDGMKISLFDISDPADVKEIDVMLLGTNTWSEAFNNPRALMVDPARSVFGFAVNGYDGKTYQSFFSYRVVGVRDGKLADIASIGASSEYDAQSRMVYIGNILYTVSTGRLAAYDYSTFELLGEIDLTGPFDQMH